MAAQRPVTATAEHDRQNYSLAGMSPTDLRALLVPRGDICQAPAEWLRLQSTWWQGGDAPGKVLTPERYDCVLDLTDGWTFTPMQDDRFTTVGGAGCGMSALALGPTWSSHR